MELAGTFQIIVSVLTALSTGGILGSFIALRYASRREKAKAKQEEEHAESLDISNTSGLIAIYKSTIDDLQSLRQKVEEQYKATIADLESRIKDYESRIKSQEEIIDGLTKNQLTLSLKIKELESGNQSINQHE